MEVDLPIFVIVVVVLCIAIYIVWNARCSRCGRFWALVEIDRKHFPDDSEHARYACKYCGHRLWRKDTPPPDPDAPPW